MHWTELKPREVVFTWENPDTKEQLTIAVERLAAAAVEQGLEIVKLAIDPEHAATLPELRDLEPHRIKRLIDIGPLKWPPILLCIWPDGSGNIVDGNHRYYIAWRAEMPVILAYMIPESIWRDYVVDMPQGLPMTGFSGIF